jgi:hypothetical protein
MSLAYALAWLAPVLLGSALCALASGRPRTVAAWMVTLGCGSVLGLLACTFAVGLLGAVDTRRIVPILLPLLLPLAIGGWVWVWLRPLGGSAIVAPRDTRIHPLGWLLLALLGVHAWLIAGEVLLRPPYPWDAWAIWLLKPKAWMLAGRIDEFVGFGPWLADASGRLRTADAWNYPEAIAHLGVWFAAAWGDWNAIAVNAAWLVLWLALLAGCYGRLREFGLTRMRTLVAIYALGSLPLINVHVALAGYADLWIATLLAFAGLAWLRWLETRRRGELALALAFALSLPAVKLEGAAWLLLFFGILVYGRMPSWMRRIALVLAPLIGVGVALGYLLHWPVIGPVLDRMGLVADTGTLLQHAPVVIEATATGMFAQYNWHLFWLAVALTLVLRWRHLAQSPSLRLLGLFLLLGCGFLFALFVLTPAGRWAESYTVVNRLGMQIVPLMLVFVALLWRDGVPITPSADARMAAAAPSLR